MVKTKIHQFKRYLPYARIYLDDVEEIVSIYQSAFAEVAPKETCEFYFEIEDNVRLDDFEDLKQHGGHVSEFSIWLTYSFMLTAFEAMPDRTRIVRISYGQPELDYPRAMEESRWELRAKLLTIFEARRDRWKIFSDSIPPWVIATGPLVAFSLIELLRRTFILMIAVAVLCLALYGAALVGVFRRSRVYLYYRRADQQERKKARQRIAKDVFIAMMGAIAGVVGTLVGEMLFKRFSH